MEKLRGPSEKQSEAIAAEIGEYEGKFEANAGALRVWLAYQTHIPKNFEPNLVPLFLRGCKHDLERTKRKLDNFFSARSVYRELYVDWDPTHPLISDASKILQVVPLPRLTEDGCRITVHRALTSNTELNILYMLRYLFMLGDIRMREETMISGDIFIFDFHLARVSDSVKLIAPWVRKGLVICHDGYPQRLKQIHLINVPKAAASLIPVFKLCMKEKLRNRFHLHVTPETLSRHIPLSALPSDYGGDEPSVASLSKMWMNKMRNSKDYLKKQSAIAADLTKKSGKHASCFQNDGVFGCDGSFRKLNID